MKTSWSNLLVLVASIFVILFLGGTFWIKYDEDLFPAEGHENKLDKKGGKFTINSEILGEERTYIVHLPMSYNDSEEAFPVLYILDAEEESVFNKAVSTVETQYSLSNTPNMIMVGIHNVNRNRDTIPVSVEGRPGSGGAHNFLRFLDEELAPHIEKIYRTTKPKILYGESNAGLFTVYALLKSPSSFDAYIASSPMIGWCPDYIHGLAEEGFNDELQDKFLFIIYGSRDYAKVTDYVPSFIDLIEEKTQESLRESILLEGVGHVPSNSLEEGLKSYFTR